MFAIVFLLDLFLVAAGSSGAVPFGASLTRFASGVHRMRWALRVPLDSHRVPLRHPALDHRPVVRHLRPSVCDRLLLRFQTRGKLTRRSPRRPVLNPYTQAIAHPVRVNQIPRQIPPQPTYLRPWVRDSLAV